jgi:hypothetical protein
VTRTGLKPENFDVRSCAPGCVKEGYLGVRVNIHGTPRSDKCELHRPGDNDCEALIPCQGCSEFWMHKDGALNGDGSPWREWERVDGQTDNCNRAHHKPNHPSQLGPTQFKACPAGDGPASPRCSEPVTVNVKVPR